MTPAHRRTLLGLAAALCSGSLFYALSYHPADPSRDEAGARQAPASSAISTSGSRATPVVGESGLEALLLEPGMESVYRVRANLSAHVSRDLSDRGDSVVPTEVPGRLGVRLSGQVGVTVIEVEADDPTAVLRVDFSAASIGRTRGEGDATALGLPSPVFLRFDLRTGTILEYSFPAEVSAQARRLVADVLATALQFAPREMAEPWSVAYPDANGSIVMAFEWAAPRILLRSAVAYTDNAFPIEVRHSRARVELAKGWFATVQARERRRVTLPGAKVSWALDVRLHERLRRSVAVSAIDTAGLHWMNPAAVGDETAPAVEVAVLPGVVAALLDKLQAAASAGTIDDRGTFDAWRQIADSATRSNEALALLSSRLLAEAGVDSALGRLLATCLGKAAAAGSESAGQLVGRLLTDGAVADGIKQALLFASHLLTTTALPVLEAVLGILADGGPSGDPLTPMQVDALLLLGSLAHADLPPAISNLAADHLIELAPRALTSGALPAWFEALVNSGHTEFVQEAIGYLGDPDPAVRRAAYHALRGLDGVDAAVGALLDGAGGTDLVEIRLTALDALCEMTPGAPIAERLAGLLHAGVDPALADALLRAIAHHAGAGLSQGAIRHLQSALRDPDRRVAEGAKEILDGRAG